MVFCEYPESASVTPVLQKMTLFENRVIADVISLVKMGSNPVWLVSLWKGNLDTETDTHRGEDDVKTQGEDSHL